MPASGSNASPPPVTSYSSPLTFEANHGQADAAVKFLSRGSDYNLFLTSAGAVLTLRSAHRGTKKSPDAVVRMKIAGTGRETEPQITGLEELPGKLNYFIGNNPEKWRTDVPGYARVKYKNLYPGVDMVYYGDQRQLEYDFVVAPGANPGVIRLAFEGVRNARLDARGDLILRVAGGEIRQKKPLVYQEIGGTKQYVRGRYLLTGKREAGFEIGKYDRSRPLIIDPVLIYSTYLGGSGEDRGYAIAVDASGNAYVTGETWSPDFPLANAPQAGNRGQSDVFVSKLNPTGTALVYSTYLGGSGKGGDVGYSIAVDAEGNAYVTGYTRSNDFPTANPLQASNRGGPDAFVTKLNATGTALVYSTYLGGSAAGSGDGDWGYGIALDVAGNAYVTGETTSTDFPTVVPLQPNKGGGRDAFVTKLNAAGTALVYSTYLGGSAYEHGGISNDFNSTKSGNRIALDAAGNAYVTGYTWSTDFPTANALQSGNRGQADVFVSKLDATGMALIYSTYLGGINSDFAYGIAVDSTGNAYVTGNTSSTDFPTTSSLQPGKNGGPDAFVTKLNATGTALVYSTYLGGSGGDFAYGIAVDATGNTYVTGETASPDFPTADLLQPWSGGGADAFVSKLNSAGTALVYSSFFGGSGGDHGAGIAVDAASNAYLTGGTISSDFPTANPLQMKRGNYDAFVAKIFSPIFSVQAIQAQRGGNSGDVSVTVLGTGFQSTATVKLKAANQTDIEGGNPHVINSSTLTATFDLRGATIGPRDVVVTLPDGSTAALRDGFTIEQGGGARVWADIIGRNAIRPDTQQTYTIVYGNRGNVDSPAPLLELSGPETVKLALSDGRPPQEAVLRIFAGGQGGRSGVLPPGTYALQVKVQTPAALGEVKLDLSIVETAGQPFNWNRLAAEGAPAGADLDDWRARVTLARSRIGESLDEVMAVLRDAARRSGEDARAFYDSDELLTYTVGIYGTNGEELSGARAASLSPGKSVKSAVNRDSQPASDSGSVQLITIAESPNPTETFVLNHGLGGLKGFDDTRTDFFEAAAALQREHPGANIYIMDWTPGAKQFFRLPNGSIIPDPFMAAANVDQAGGAAFKLLRSKQLDGFFDPAKATLIGESLGNSVNGRIAQSFEEHGFGKVGRALVLNPPRLLGLDPFFRTSFSESVAISTNSWLDHKLKYFADYSLYSETGTRDPVQQHMSGILKLRDHPELAGIFDDPRLRKSSVPFFSDGSIRLDAAYDPTPFSFLLDSLLSRDLWPLRVLWRTLFVSVVNSRDPNDKAGPLGAGEPRFILGAEPLRYMLSMENVATATASARDVVITDQLDTAKVDLDSFSLGPISFGPHLLVPPPGLSQYTANADLRPENELLVNVDARLNKETGMVTWKFTSLDPATGQPTDDPLAGFLPPNVNPPEGDGSVFFSVMPRQDLPTGTEVRNQAAIVFDTNAAIQTPAWSNKLDNSAPASEVHALTAAPCSANVNVQWSGADTGSGIRDYTIYVSDNGGPFTVWRSRTSATSDTYAGQLDHTYAFYSVAQDETGNVEDSPLDPDAAITPASRTPPTFTSVPPAITVSTGQGATACQAVVSDAALGTAIARDSCSGSLPVVRSGVPKGNRFPVGTTVITYTATDAVGNKITATQTVTVLDAQTPTIKLTGKTIERWPDNHRYKTVRLRRLVAGASDHCDGKVSGNVVIAQVSSDEPEDAPGGGDGNTVNDIVIAPDCKSVRLRAERQDHGNGRVYTITFNVKDAAGNTAAATAKVRVPESRNRKPAVDDRPSYTVTGSCP